LRLYRILLDPQGGEGTSPTDPPEDKGKAPDLKVVAEKLIEKHGSESEAVRVLLNENHSYRDQLRDLKAKIPGEGTVVLSGDDAAHWSAYRDLGKPEDLKKQIKDGLAEREELGVFRREKSLAVIAKAAGVENVSAFLKVAATPEQHVVKEEKKDGKDIASVFVKDGDNEVAFETFYADFLPSLRPAKPDPKGTPSRASNTTPIVPEPTAVRKREPSLVR